MHDPFSQAGKAPRRPQRVASEIMRMLPDLIRRHIKLPEAILVSVIDVEVTKDLSWAKIYFSVLGENEEQQGKIAERVLNEKSGTLRKHIASVMVMRQHPQLRFIYDTTVASAARIESLLKKIADERKDGSPES
jgi:ribosome-binding factor A